MANRPHFSKLRADPRVELTDLKPLPSGKIRVQFDVERHVPRRELAKLLASWAPVVEVSPEIIPTFKEDLRIIRAMYEPLLRGKKRLTQGQTRDKLGITLSRVKKALERRPAEVKSCRTMFERHSHRPALAR